MLKHIPEPKLAQRLLESDERAFREVFDRYHRKIYQFAFNFLKNKDESEEVVQDTFLSFWLYRGNINITKPIAPLLFTIARRSLIDAWRKSATSLSFQERIAKQVKSSNNDTEEQVLVEDLERFVQEGFQQLNEHQQQTFNLSRYEGLSYEEIAVEMNISKSTVKYHLVGALKIMRAHFTKNDMLYFYFIAFYLEEFM